MKIRTKPFEPMVEAALDVLAAGPATIDELQARAVDNVGSGEPVHLLDDLLTAEPLVNWHEGDIFYRVDELYTGITFTTVVTAAEIEEERIDVGHLAMLDDISRAGLLGDRLRVDVEPGGAARIFISGPPGWLDASRAETACGFTFTGEHIEFSPVVETPPAEDLDEVLGSLSRAYGVQPDTADAVESWQIVAEALVKDSVVWRTVLPPLDELFAACGLSRHGEYVGPAGTDWETEALTRDSRIAASLFGLDEAEGLSVAAALVAYETHDTAGEGLGPLLSLGDVAPAVWHALSVVREEPVESIEAFAAATVAAAPTPNDAVGTRWLEARCVIERGDVVSAEPILQDIHRLDRGHRGTLEQLGWIAFDRGRFKEARRQLDAAGVEKEGLFDYIDQLAGPASAGVGRNEPCPCGSGRKFKQCHGRPGEAEPAPLTERAVVLFQKVARSLSDWRAAWRMWPNEWPGDRQAGFDDLRQLDHVGIVTDLVLFEDGYLPRFLSERGHLLPDDERALAQEWLLSERTVLRIASSDGEDERAEAVDIRTGVTIALELDAEASLPEEGLFLARPLAAGNGRYRLFGGARLEDEAHADKVVGVLESGESAAGALAKRLIDVLTDDESDTDTAVMCAGVVRVERDDALEAWMIETFDAARSTSGALTGASDRCFAISRGSRVTIAAESEAEYEALISAVSTAAGPVERVIEQGADYEVLIEEVLLLNPEADRSHLGELVIERAMDGLLAEMGL